MKKQKKNIENLSWFKKETKGSCPIDEDMRQWIEYAFKWLVEEFGEEFFHSVRVYSSMKELLNSFEKETATFKDLGTIVAYIMFIEEEDYILSVYDEGLETINTDSGPVLVNSNEDEQLSAGLYFGKNENGKFDVGIERKLLKDPINLVSTIAHEFSHIKLLGENRLKVNDEYLTDLVPIMFGLGVFGANSSYGFKQSNSFWSYKTSGYLTQMEWGYALAVYSWLRNNKSPDWLKSLPKNIQSDYKKSLVFMENNQGELFQQEL